MLVKTNVNSMQSTSQGLVSPTRCRQGISLDTFVHCALLLALIMLPYLLDVFGGGYYLSLACRILIVSMAAIGLNMLVGYGGMVALGHASFVGVGAYTVVALTYEGVVSVWGLMGAAALVSAAIAALTGVIVLRTRGVFFIMVSLACAQLLYYLAVSLRIYGGDDGYNLPQPLDLGFGWTNFDETAFYWVVLGLAVICFVGLNHVLNSRFGIALSAARDNEARMIALGYSVPWVRLASFILAGALAGLSGALLIAHNQFVTPSVMHWLQSANLVVMVIVGGLGYRWGGVVGVVIWQLLEEFLRQITTHWHWPLGLILIALVLIAPRGVCSLRFALSQPSSR